MIKPDFIVNCAIYPIEVGVFFTKEKAHKWAISVGYEIDQASCLAWTKQLTDTEKDEHHFVMYLPKDCDISVVCHEAAHMTFYIMDFVGVPIDDENQEAFCYLQEYLVKKIVKRLKNE